MSWVYSQSLGRTKTGFVDGASREKKPDELECVDVAISLP